MAPEVLLSLVTACAPLVHPITAGQIVKVESAMNPWAIGINGPYRLSRQPINQTEAVRTARMLIVAGHNIDMGLAMINVKNLPRLGMSVEQVFDPCTNLRAMQTILSEAYVRASTRHGPGQNALKEALSAYNTGSPHRGLANGYVSKIFALNGGRP